MTQDPQPSEYPSEWKNLMGIRVAQLHRTGGPIDDLSFGLEGPRNGWLFFHIELGSAGKFACRVSGEPNDFLYELVATLTDLLNEKEGIVRMHAEPNTFILRFTPSPSQGVDFLLLHRHSFEGSAATDEPILGLPLADAKQLASSMLAMLEAFMSTVEDATYQAEMQHPFPKRQLNALGSVLGNLPPDV
jgi:hypothetical protein